MSNSHNVKNLLSKYIEYLIETPLKYPINGLDYSSLYPSLIMTYNLSPEYLILDKEYKDEIKEKEIHNINFEYKYENYLGEKKIKYIEEVLSIVTKFSCNNLSKINISFIEP